MRAAGLARGAAVVTVVVAFALVAVLAVVLVPWDWVPGGALVPASAEDLFTAEQLARSERFAGLQRLLSWSAFFVSLAVLAVLGFTRLGARLVRRVSGSARWWLAVPTGVLVVLLVGRLATLPFAVGAHRVNLAYGTSNQAWAAWSLDRLLGLLVSWLATSLLLLVVVGAARRSPRWWFAWAGGAGLVLAVVGSFLYPVVVEPLFNRFTSLPQGPFRESVFRLADRQGVRIDDVLVADASRRTTTLNAYVSGIGSTRRVVVYDNLIEDLPPEEALLVVAHELGHAKHHDVVLGTALASLGAVGAIALLALLLESPRLRRRAGVAGAGDPAVVALVLALAAVGGFAVAPLQNTVSRAVEARADRESLASGGSAEAFVRMQQQLALKSLADPDPPELSRLWRASHPTVLQRAGLPRSLREADE